MATRTRQVINQGSAHLGLKELCVFPAHCLETNTRSTLFPFWGHKPCSLSRQADNGPKSIHDGGASCKPVLHSMLANPWCFKRLGKSGDKQKTNRSPKTYDSDLRGQRLDPCIVVPFGGHSYVPPKPVSSRSTCSANESCWAMRWATSLSHQGGRTHMSYLKSLGSSRHQTLLF